MDLSNSIKNILDKKDNDYSPLEPFTDNSIISSSIIIPVYNNAKIFKKTLENLSSHPEIRRHPSEFEITIINDGSTEDITSIVKKTKFPCNLNYVSYKQNLGRSHARNKGIDESSKDLLFFFDADILLPGNYFNSMWKIHNSLGKVLSLGLAQNIQDKEEILEDVYAKNINPDITDDFRYYKKFSKGKFENSEFWLIKETNWFKDLGFGRKIGPWTLPKMAVAHNLGIKSETVKKIGGFDERFKAWGYEDAHLGAKAIAHGCYLIPSKETGAVRILDGKKKKFDDQNRELYERLINSESA